MALILRRAKKNIQRLLISRTDRIGDVMQTLPAIEAAARLIGHPVSVLCQEMTAPLFKNNPFIDEVIALSPQGKPTKSAGLILQFEFDALLVMVNDPLIQGLMPYLHPIPIRMGPLSKPKMLKHFNYPVLQKRSKCRLNEAAYNVELVEALTNQVADPQRPLLYFSDAEISSFALKLGELLPELDRQKGYGVLHSGMSGSALNWPFESYLELAQKITQSGRQLVLSGMGEVEEQRNQALADHSPNRVWNLTNLLNLRELAMLASGAELFIGPSTGPTHVANGSGCKIISFYPPIRVQSAARWAPFMAEGEVFTPRVQCPDAFKCIEQACPYFECMGLISVESVWQATQTLWPVTP